MCPHMKKASFTIFVVSVLMSGAFVSKAHAVVFELPGSEFEVDYTFDLQVGTLHGSDITDIFIFETDGTQVSVDYAYTAASSGSSNLNHVISFEPTSALVIGLDLAVPGVGHEKDHVVMFMENGFAAANFGKKFSEVFPAVGNGDRVRHSQQIASTSNAASTAI